MKIEGLEIDKNGFKIYYVVNSQEDIVILKKILHSILSTYFLKLDLFESYELQIGEFSLEYDINSEFIEITDITK